MGRSGKNCDIQSNWLMCNKKYLYIFVMNEDNFNIIIMYFINVRIIVK